MSPEDKQPKNRQAEDQQPAKTQAKPTQGKAKSAPASPKAGAAKTKAGETKNPPAKAAAKKPAGKSPASADTAKTQVKKAAASKPAAKPPAAKKPASKSKAQSTQPPATQPIPLSPDAQVITAPQAPAASSAPAAVAVTKPRRTRAASARLQTSGLWPLIKHKAPLYWRLTRMHKPIGSLLLLWPTLWSLWLAAKGLPSLKNLLIFVLGVLVMRSAGCVINDFADRKVDGQVKRTQDRPLATGEVSPREAIGLFICLCLVAFGLVLLTNPLTIQLSVGGLLLAFCYPFMKRYTHLPQLVLGAAFAWGIPMAYAAETNSLPDSIWLVYIANLLWTVAYDTFYAMVDRDDDIKIGVKSTAILFGEQDRLITGLLQGLTLYSLYIIGERFELGGFYWASLIPVAGLFAYQQWLIRFRARQACFQAFLNNNWVGASVFAGIALHFLFSAS